MRQSYLLGVYEKSMPNTLSLKEKLTAAKECGYDFLELSVDETDEKLSRLDWTEEQRLSVLTDSRKIGVPISTMCLSGHRKYPLGSENPETAARGMVIMEKALKLAQDLGIRVIQLAGYDEYYQPSNEKTREIFLKNLQRAVEMASAYKVMLGFETMETPFMDTCAKAMEYVQKIDSPYLAVYPDIGNLTNAAKLYHTDVLADLETGRGHIAAMHLKETIPGHYREILFGEGHVDFQAAIETAMSMGVRSYTAEFWYLDGRDWRADMKFNNQVLRGKF